MPCNHKGLIVPTLRKLRSKVLNSEEFNDALDDPFAVSLLLAVESNEQL